MFKVKQIFTKNHLLLLLIGRGGVLEDTFWSPWPWPWRSSPWPWPRGLKFSKIALSLARGQHFFLNCLNFVGRLKKILEDVFYWRTPEKIFLKIFFFWDRLKNFFEELFFSENTSTCVLGPWPWPQAFLSLASRGSVLGRAFLGLGLGFFFVSLALASSLVSSTPPLLIGLFLVYFNSLEVICFQSLKVSKSYQNNQVTSIKKLWGVLTVFLFVMK